jgi:hypothetical protein
MVRLTDRRRLADQGLRQKMATLNETRELAIQKQAELVKVLRDCLGPAKKMSRKQYADILDQMDISGDEFRAAMAEFYETERQPLDKADPIQRNNIKTISGLLSLATGQDVDCYGDPLDHEALCSYGYIYMQGCL